MVIRKDHLSIFFSDEIQLLISGGIEAEIDIEDLRKHTQYNGYTDRDPYINEFWKIVKSFTPDEKEKLLQFVTACNRPPLLGFKYLYPQFCIH
jgi:ubiquitin-protein ligase E3 C